jgi:hypothetical protein
MRPLCLVLFWIRTSSELVHMITNMDDDLRPLLLGLKPVGRTSCPRRDVSKTTILESIMHGINSASCSRHDGKRDPRLIHFALSQVDQDALMQEASAMLAGLAGAGGMGAIDVGGQPVKAHASTLIAHIPGPCA